MGIINHDPFLVPYSGTNVTETYIHLQSEMSFTVQREKKNGSTKYTIGACFVIHYNKQASIDNREPIGSVFVRIDADNTVLNDEPIITLLYDELKRKYSNYTDDP